ncbi:multiheme c-type cytochrome [Candidatus Neomarinimicrobiota bacterium]
MNFIKLVSIILSTSFLIFAQNIPTGDHALGTKSYDDFEESDVCQSCHNDIYQQWKQSMMSQSYTHHWDEIEYFELAVPHGEVNPMYKPVADGCNGCHTPMAFFAGDVPPPRPEENSRANDGVNCEVCHSIKGFEGDVPFNFNYISDPSDVKLGPKENLESPYHEIEKIDFMSEAEYCGTCHNEKNPYDVWVKSTQLEWAEGPYAEQGVACHQCHMPKAMAKNAKMSDPNLVSQHLFHGAHDPGKVASVVEIRMHPSEREVEIDDGVVLNVQLFNAKTGHKFPSGSVEDRIVWLDVTATDSEGKVYHLPVDTKGFEGEEYTIASNELAYTDMGIPLKIPNFEGVQRDGVPIGDRIFRMPYFDENGIMTIMQWNTRSLGIDYRFGPRETKIETYTFEMPEDVAPGKITFNATLNFQKLVKPVADYLKVPEEESEIILVNTASTWVEIYE